MWVVNMDPMAGIRKHMYVQLAVSSVCSLLCFVKLLQTLRCPPACNKLEVVMSSMNDIHDTHGCYSQVCLHLPPHSTSACC